MRHLRMLWLGAAVMLTACQRPSDAPAGPQQASLLPTDQTSGHVIVAAPPAAHTVAPRCSFAARAATADPCGADGRSDQAV